MKTRKASSAGSDQVVAIPSQKRAETLRDKTLATLKHQGIEPHRIQIFLANESEKDDQEKVIDQKSYHKMVVGVPKIGPQRNFMSDYFPVGKPVVQMDDDIQSLIEFSPRAKRHEAPLKSLKEVIARGFKACRDHNCSLWGIQPVANGQFMRPGYTTDLKFVIGALNGCFNPGTKGPKGVKLSLEMDKEDQERSIRFQKRDGGVIRLRDVAPKTAYQTEKGGNQEYRTMETVMEGAKKIVKMFPEFCELNLTKKSGYPEVRLKDTTRKSKAESKTKAKKSTRRTTRKK